MELTITKENAQKAYNDGCPDVKKVLENLFGKKYFIPEDITDQIKTFEDAYKYLGIKTFKDAYKVLKLDRRMFGETSISECEDEVMQLMIICHALNEKWEPNWNDGNQYKYYPYFDMRDGSGFAFSGANYVYWTTCTDGGSRLCFKSEKLAKYAGTQFMAVYKKFLKK